jgi:hypothetical protein
MVRLSSVLATAGTWILRGFRECVQNSTLTMLQAALVSTTLAISTSTASGFVSSDGSVSFSLNIPNEQDDSTELFFVLSGPSSSSWIVGYLTTLTRSILIDIGCWHRKQ